METVKKGIAYVIKTAVKLALIIVIAYPFFWMFFTAFKPYAETAIYPPTFLPHEWVLDGFKLVLGTIDISRFALNSVIVSISVLVLQYLIIIPAAYGFARCQFRGRSLLFGIVLLGFMVPQQVTFVPIYIMFSKWGILQSYLPQVLPFISNAFGIFLLRQYFMQVPEEIIEAARLDNAGELQIIMRIMIPMAKTALFTVGLLSFISSWNAYFWPLIMTTRDTFRPLAIGVSMLNNLDGGRQWHMLMAGNLFLVLPILIAYFVANKRIRSAFVSYSGIK